MLPPQRVGTLDGGRSLKAYDSTFLEYTARSSVPSAQRVTQIVSVLFPVRSVLDVGCGYGTWLRAWREVGVSDAMGIDGPWVDGDQLLIPKSAFLIRNIEEPIDLGRRFDVVQSLEVAEHLPHACAAQFVRNLTVHSDAVLFSAAPPGQGGEHHVNEQPYEYWRSLFAHHGFAPVDCIRPLLAGDLTIRPWYRYNTLLYIRVAQPPQISKFAALFALSDTQRIMDIAPWTYRVRRTVIRHLPRPVQHGLARIVAFRGTRSRSTQRTAAK